jgi:hypothetical protein
MIYGYSVLTKGTSAEIQIALRNIQIGAVEQTSRGVPLEPFATNKDMGRILIRRGGETIAAGMFCSLNVQHRYLQLFRCCFEGRRLNQEVIK